MGKYDSKLLGSEEVAQATREFHFEKPQGFDFTPGQVMNLVLPEDFPGAGDDRRRTFSIASAPHDDRLSIATRMRDSAFKQALGAAEPGAAVRIVGPTGTMTLRDDPGRAIVMIAGGIGITPFISMLRSAAAKESPCPMALIYSNSRPETAAYMNELRAFAKNLDGFRFVPTMTGMKDTGSWDGETRRVDPEMVEDAASGLPKPQYYIAGAPDMSEDMREMLSDMGIAGDDIVSEGFFGYT